ncbi:MAG: hypothetical protein M3308_09010 [Actinomycetota bacterium]|nr:hypothetical protein [Actinomycetota bacterium]
MLENDARRIAASIEDGINTGAAAGQEVKATVNAERWQPSTSAPGASLPTYTTYKIQINDGKRVAVLPLDQATTLLDEIEPGWDPDRLFAAIRSRDILVEDAN